MNLIGNSAASPPTAESPFGPVPAVWCVDPDRSVARFSSATLWGRVPVRGRLGRLRGTLSWEGAGGCGRLAIAAAGLSSGIKLRDHHLRSGAFFDVDNHPELRFEAGEVVLAGGGHVHLRGELFVRGSRRRFECTRPSKRLTRTRSRSRRAPSSTWVSWG
jgi:polyisoprenoid-binding protein YceI